MSLKIINKSIFCTSNGYQFYFDNGNFDEYRVHGLRPNKKDWFPLDKEYLAWIKRMGNRYGCDIVYDDFLKVYDIAREDYDFNEACYLINEIDNHYHNITEKWWVVFYMTMIAEECKENAILKKRIKRLGVYNVLFDDYGPAYTAHYMRGMDWKDLNNEMLIRDFGIII